MKQAESGERRAPEHKWNPEVGDCHTWIITAIETQYYLVSEICSMRKVRIESLEE